MSWRFDPLTGKFQTTSLVVGSTVIGGTSGKIPYNNSGLLGEANVYIDSANQVSQRNSTSAQTKLLYRTYTDASNYERLAIGADDAAAGLTGFSLFVQQAGTGAARGLWVGTVGNAAIAFVTNNSARWNISGAGNILANTDNSFNIGASNANRPQHVYVGSNVYATAFVITRGATSYASIHDNGDGIIRLLNGAGTGFNLLLFGGTTSSFPALKRSTTTLQARLADDSAYADFYAKGLYSNETAPLIRANGTLTSLAGASTATLTNSPTAGNPSDWVPIYINGNRYAIPVWYNP